MQRVGAYEAKTHVSHLIEAVANGETITKHGVPVAMLAPPPEVAHPDMDAAIDAWLEMRKRLRADAAHVGVPLL